MASLFGGMDVVPDWVSPNSRFASIAAGQATARNFMDAYNQAANRKQDQTQFDKRLGFEKTREERIRLTEEDDRRRAEAAAERARKDFEFREAERKRIQAERDRAEKAAGYVNDQIKIRESVSGEPPTPQEMLQYQLEGWKRFQPEKFQEFLEGTRKIQQQAESLNRPINTYNVDGQTAIGIPTGPSSQRIITGPKPAVEKPPVKSVTVAEELPDGTKVTTRMTPEEFQSYKAAKELAQQEEAKKPGTFKKFLQSIFGGGEEEPKAAAPPTEGKTLPPEGTVAVDPKTGKRIIVKGGKWQPL